MSKETNPAKSSAIQTEHSQQTTHNEVETENYVDVDFDDSYGGLKLHKEDLTKLSRSAMALIAHRGKLQLFNRKSVSTPINEVSISEISYKNIALLKKFLTPGNNIISSRITSAEYRRQRVLQKAIKRARELAILPYPGQKQKSDNTFNS